MTSAGDYRGEMSAAYEIDDDTAEAVLAGRAVSADMEPLVRVMSAYRAAARRPIRPRGELAAFMASGAFRFAPGRGRSAPAAAKEKRAPVELLSRLAGVSIAVKAIVVAAIALVSFGTAAVAGVLPDPVQDRVDSVVGSVTNREPPAPDTKQSEFGDRVSEDARDGGVDGPEISEEARQQGEQRAPAEPPRGGRPSELPTPDDVPANPPTSPPAGRPDDLPTPPTHPQP